jgi:hypothetical protein
MQPAGGHITKILSSSSVVLQSLKGPWLPHTREVSESYLDTWQESGVISLSERHKGQHSAESRGQTSMP